MNGYHVNKRNCALIADIGATHSRVARVYLDNLNEYEFVDVFKSGDFNGPDEIVHAYCQKYQIECPDLILLAIAAPVDLDEICFVNNHWTFKLSDIKNKLFPAKVYFYNDVEMLGFALPHLPKASFVQIGGGESSEFSPKLALSLGSGIGTSLTVFNHDWFVIPSEGGHSNMMIEDEFMKDFWSFLKTQGKDEIIVEDFIAGKKGIPQLISFMSDYFKLSSPTTDPVELLEQLISKKDTFAVQLFARYCDIIGTVTKNYTLITGAKSVYLAGGIIPKFLEFFAQSDFRSSFEESPSVGKLLKKIPTFVVTDPYPALIGLTRKVAYMKETKE